MELCAGVGGMTLGMQIAGGFETVAFSEINPFCQQILAERFRNVPIIPDIKDVSANTLRHLGISTIDGIVAGLPCPPFSLAGKRKASQDPRNLFDEFFRILEDVHPRWAVLENVPGLLSAEKGEFFRKIIRRFTEMGYVCLWGIYSAAAVGAVHLRKRIWIIAYSESDRWGTPRDDRPQKRSNVTSCNCSCQKAI
ncbi:DNA cytosine methyltransferase, partial [Aetokthonos hydrillicola]